MLKFGNRVLVILLLGMTAYGSRTLSAQTQSARDVADRMQAQEKAQQLLKLEKQLSVIDGLVTDTTLRPMADVDVSLVGLDARITTVEGGRFRFVSVPPGQYLVIVRRIGYSPVSGVINVPASDTARLSYALVRAAMLDTLHVVDKGTSFRLLGFEMRKRRGDGQFLTGDEIAAGKLPYVSSYLRRFRGVDVSQIGGGFGTATAYSRRGSAFGGACAMTLLLDGVPLATRDLDLLPPPQAIAGIEVYESAINVPPELAVAVARCGAIAIWTKDRP